jgi:diguanylate cyclase (GGDEF)-like protein
LPFLAPSFDPWVVLGSLVIATLASFVSLELAKGGGRHHRLDFHIWWLAGSVVMGTGIWSMHFIGMLSYSLPIPLGYDRLPTLVSWLAGVGVSAVALWVASRGPASPLRLVIGSTAMAAGICAMHYTGMSAVRLAPGIVWNWPLVGASVLVAWAASAASLWIFAWLRASDDRQMVRQSAAAVLMAAAITGMHYTGMAAVNVPAGAVCLSADELGGDGLVGLLFVATGGLLAITLLVLLHGKASRLARSLQEVNTELQRANRELEGRALRDPLTALPNRLLFEDRLRQAVSRCDRHAGLETPSKLAVVFVDLDRFKPINDRFGHACGDAVLRETARRLASIVRASDTLARIGGDEFLLLLEDIGSQAAVSEICHRVLACLGDRFDMVPDREARISASIGVAMYPEHGAVDKLVINADLAMYAAKRDGGSTFRCYEPRMGEEASSEVDLEVGLRQAVERQELFLQYQPKIEARTGNVAGVEALLRWNRMHEGFIAPAVFIPMAERLGLMVPIGNWVIEEACRQAGEWLRSGLILRVAINVSAVQLRQSDFVEQVAAALRRHGVDPGQLRCEVTESVAMEDVVAAQVAFDGLRRLGVYLSIDDFGTGYSSLSCLRQLPAQELKIDRSFVKDLESSRDARAVVDAVVRLAHALGLSVVAEGVETKRQAEIAVAAGCDELQGYHFSAPLGAREVVRWIAENQQRVAGSAAARVVGPTSGLRVAGAE